MLAFGAAYSAVSKCEISMYHYLIAIHMSLSGLCTSIAAGYIVRKYHQKNLTVLVRLVIMTICWVSILRFKDSTPSRGEADIYRQIPAPDQPNSVVLLPAFCLLDPSISPLQNLTEAQRGAVENRGTSRKVPAQLWGFVVLLGALWIANVGTMVLWKWWPGVVLVGEPGDPDDDDDDAADHPSSQVWGQVVLIGKQAAWYFCLLFIIYNWIVVWQLRGWLDRSGWLERDGDGRNAENDARGIGQLAPLIALGAMAFALADKLTEKVQRGLGWMYPIEGGRVGRDQDGYYSEHGGGEDGGGGKSARSHVVLQTLESTRSFDPLQRVDHGTYPSSYRP